MNNSRDNSREFQNSPFSTFSPGKIRKFVVTRTRRRRKSTRERMNEQEEGGRREISTTHLSAGSTRWRTCSKPATEEVVYRVEAVASVEEAP